MALSKGKLSTTYTVDSVNTKDESMREFLFSLGCYPGEEVTIVSKLASNFVINIKDSRYSIDEELASTIVV